MNPPNGLSLLHPEPLKESGLDLRSDLIHKYFCGSDVHQDSIVALLKYPLHGVEGGEGLSCRRWSHNQQAFIGIPVRWKNSMLKTPVFRRYRGTELSADEAMLYFKVRDHIGQQSLDSGYGRQWTPRFARRGAGNAADGASSNSICPLDAGSDAVPSFFP